MNLNRDQKNFLNKMLTMAYKEVRIHLKNEPNNPDLLKYEEMIISLLEELHGEG